MTPPPVVERLERAEARNQPITLDPHELRQLLAYLVALADYVPPNWED